MGRVKRIWYLLPMRAAKVQASLRIRAVSPEPSLLAHRSSESRGTFRQKARSLAPLNGWACAVKIFHDGVFEDTNSLDAAQMIKSNIPFSFYRYCYRSCLTMMAGVGVVHKLLKKTTTKKKTDIKKNKQKKQKKKQSGSGETELSQFWRMRHSKIPKQNSLPFIGMDYLSM